ncbi:calcium-binding protein [Streptomyces sp. NPDC005955]|uniref:calcium-binding protein n=1 Tax=Streptomyces sp. NPDC005955 TaxID=3364738 RepID=UPI003695AC68
MRIRASVAVVTGALALSALSVPSAQAADRELDFPGTPGPSAYSSGSGKITKVTVNGGKNVAIGLGKKKFTVEVSASNKGGVGAAVAVLWRGSTPETAKNFLEPQDAGDIPCKYTRTTATCKFSFVADPKVDLSNGDAGKWKVWAMAVDGNGDTVALKENYKSVTFQRAAQATANATPEPVKKGKTVTVTGSLTRASWDNNKYNGFASGSVKLQYKKLGTSQWKTLKTVSADSSGKVKATTTATSDGYYRFQYAGSTTTGYAASVADKIDVR